MNNLKRSLITVPLFLVPFVVQSRAADLAEIGDEVVVRALSAPLKAGSRVVSHAPQNSTFKVLDSHDGWLLVEAKLDGRPQKLWIHQNQVATLQAATSLGDAPVPLANLLSATRLDPLLVTMYGNLAEIASAAMDSGREDEFLVSEKELLGVVDRVKNNPAIALKQVDFRRILGEVHLSAGHSTQGTAFLNAACQLAERGLRDNPAQPRPDPRQEFHRSALYEMMGICGRAEAKHGNTPQGEKKLAAATAGIHSIHEDGDANIRKLLYGEIDGRIFTAHAELLVKLGRLKRAQEQLITARQLDSRYEEMSQVKLLNASGTAGWPESLLGVCSVYQGDEDAAFRWTIAAQQALLRWGIWSGHTEDPLLEITCHEKHEASADESFDIALSLLHKFPAHRDAADLAIQWVVNRKLMQEEVLQRQWDLVRRTPASRHKRLPDGARLRLPDNIAELATPQRILEIRGLVADYRLRTIAAEDRREATREFETLRYLGNLFKSLHLWGDTMPGAKKGESYSQYHRREAQRIWVEVSHVRRHLNDGQTLIEFVRYNHFDFPAPGKPQRWLPPRYLACIVSSNGRVARVDLGEAEPLEAAIRKVRAGIKSSGGEAGTIAMQGEREAIRQLEPALDELAARLIDPIRPHLESQNELIISPDSDLWLVPWAALPWQKDQCLLEHFALRLVMSGRTLLARDEKLTLPEGPIPVPGPPVIIADPNFDLAIDEPPESSGSASAQAAPRPSILVARRGNNILPVVGRLPFTRVEGEQIAPLVATYTKTEPIVYLGDEAVEHVIAKMERPRVLVVSTHGFFLPAVDARSGNPMLAIRDPTMACGLLLAGCNHRNEQLTLRPADGVLTGYEVAGLDLRGTELVVLSACDTGLGIGRSSEGVVGLRQSFQAAGAETVLASLWQIPDRDTALIMIDFFKNLAAGQSKPAALRNAQLARIVRAKLDTGIAGHPLYWAALTLTEK